MNYQAQERDSQNSFNDSPDLGSASSYKIARPGQRPLSFRGTELAMAMSFTPEIPYWYEINLFRSQSREFVVAIKLFFQSEDRDDRAHAWAVSSFDEAIEKIQSYDAGWDVHIPLCDFEHMSPAELAVMAMQMKSNVESMRQHYAGLAGELLMQISEMDDNVQ